MGSCDKAKTTLWLQQLWVSSSTCFSVSVLTTVANQHRMNLSVPSLFVVTFSLGNLNRYTLLNPGIPFYSNLTFVVSRKVAHF